MTAVNKDVFLDWIRPGVTFNEEFYKRLYGYNICFPGFAETALNKLESIGITNGREQYQRFVDKYEAWKADQERSAVKCLRSQWEKEERAVTVKQCKQNSTKSKRQRMQAQR